MKRDSYFLDLDKRIQFENDVAIILEHFHDLDSVVVPRLTRYSAPVRHSQGEKLPFNVAASDLLQEMIYSVPAICECAGYASPARGSVGVVDCLVWLGGNVMRVATCEDSPAWGGVVAGWARRIVTLVDRPKPLVLIGKCECGHFIYREAIAGVTTCERCGVEIDVVGLRAETEGAWKCASVSKSRALSFMAARGVPVSTQYRWLEEVESYVVGGRRRWSLWEIYTRVEERNRRLALRGRDIGGA